MSVFLLTQLQFLLLEIIVLLIQDMLSPSASHCSISFCSYYCYYYFYKTVSGWVGLSLSISFPLSTLAVFKTADLIHSFLLVNSKNECELTRRKEQKTLFQCSRNNSTHSSLQNKLLSYRTDFKNCRITDCCR